MILDGDLAAKVAVQAEADEVHLASLAQIHCQFLAGAELDRHFRVEREGAGRGRGLLVGDHDVGRYLRRASAGQLADIDVRARDRDGASQREALVVPVQRQRR
jgi:hypothetical protein